MTWIGHSTVLVQLDGVNFLTDPTWADRSGPFSGFIGVRRYTPPGIPFDDLPPIDFVLISHDHYDHLDEPTVRRLARTSDPLFVVPLGIKAWLADRGITNAVELDWGESVTVKGLTVVCTPAQHGGGRTPSTRAVGSGPRGRCWARSASTSAATPATIATSRRPATGSAPSTWPRCRSGPTRRATSPRPVHISPEEALQAALDLRASHMLGMHWGTFALAREPYDEPPARMPPRSSGAGSTRTPPGSSSRARPGPGSFSLPPTGRGQGEGPTSSSTGTGSSRAVGSRSRA